MPKQTTRQVCQECGEAASKWFGKCPACGAWGTLVEEISGGRRVDAVDPVDPLAAFFMAGGATPVPLLEVDVDDADHRPTGIGEFDRVLGGGLVPGAAILISGEPGAGKSTLLLQALNSAVERLGGGSGLLVTAEESKEQVRLRADRLGGPHPRCFVLAEESVAGIVAQWRSLAPSMVVVDSIQTVRDPRIESAPGSVAQVRESAAALIAEAKRSGATLVLVGHVTKDGGLAGPRVLEHLVDAVLTFEGDRHHSLRFLRSVKNRFGPAGEVGIFSMEADGLREVADGSSALLVGTNRTAGSAVTCVVEGRRPLLVEVQVLATRAPGTPRRHVTGIDANRFAVLGGVIEKRLGVPLGTFDLFASVTGGVRTADPGAELAVCASIVSSAANRRLDPTAMFVGEVGLGGEVRPVPHLDRRVREASRLGFTTAVVPALDAAALAELVPDLKVLGVATVAEATQECVLP